MQDTITNPPFNPIGSLRNENVERPGRQKMATESWDFLSLSALTRQIGQRKLKQKHSDSLGSTNCILGALARLNAPETLVSPANSKATEYISREVIFFKKDPRFARSQLVLVPSLPPLGKIWISVRFRRNCPPTPPQTQHFVLSGKLLSTLGYGLGWVLNIPFLSGKC